MDKWTPDSDGRTPVALYIHWPWCKAKCPYCDFNSHAGTIYEQDYVDGLLRELASWNEARLVGGFKTAAFTEQNRRVESVFFGGGTPSLIRPENLKLVIDSCRRLGVFDATTEVTVECNPTSFDDTRPARAFFEDLKAAGVTRVSIGIQGFKQEWLTFLGRTHRVEEALAALDAAQAVFDNVNADLIYGLPGQTVDAWVEQLETLAQRGLTHISAYQLTIEKNTHFYSDVRKGLWEPISGDAEADFFDATRATLLAAGYENYEISNFAKPGKACRHNVHVWNYGDYLGIGAGAHGRVMTDSGTVVATQVVRQPDGYLRRLKDLADPLSLAVALDAPETIQEAVFSGLRLAAGVDVESLIKRFGKAFYEQAILTPEIGFLTEAGLLKCMDGRLSLTEQGWPRLNGILGRLLRPLRSPAPRVAPPTTHLPSEYKSPVTVTIE